MAKEKNEDILENAKQLIRAKQYDEAKVLLITLDHPEADRMLEHLNAMSLTGNMTVKEDKGTGCRRWLRIVGGLSLFLCICSTVFSLYITWDAAQFGPTRTIQAQTQVVLDIYESETQAVLDVYASETQSIFDSYASETAIPTATAAAATGAAQTATATLWTRTPTPVPTNTRPPRPTSVPDVNISEYTYSSIGNFYALTQGVRGRSCPFLDCEVVIVLDFREGYRIVGSTNDGNSVNGDTLWFVGDLDSGHVFFHSSLISRNRPADPNAPAPSRRPSNCAEAIQMGLSAQQAAQWSHLDRDNDGVACYGD